MPRPFGGGAEPGKSLKTVLFLIDSDFTITGECIRVNGGGRLY